MFANSPAETKTSTERAAVQNFANQMGDIATIVTAVATAVFFTMLLVTGNTMAQSVRERVNEIAVLKTLGYSKRTIAGLVLTESFLITAIGGAIGLGLAALMADSIGDLLAAFFPVIGIPVIEYVIGERTFKAMLFQQMVFLLIPMLTLSSGQGVGPATWSVPFFIVFSHAWLALSMLGIDGPGLKLLLQSPVAGSQILLGRVLAIGRLFAVIDVVAVAVLTVVMALVGGLADPWRRFFEMATACLIADGIMVGAGAFISVLAPFPLIRRSRSIRMRQEGCATTSGARSSGSP